MRSALSGLRTRNEMFGHSWLKLGIMSETKDWYTALSQKASLWKDSDLARSISLIFRDRGIKRRIPFLFFRSVQAAIRCLVGVGDRRTRLWCFTLSNKVEKSLYIRFVCLSIYAHTGSRQQFSDIVKLMWVIQVNDKKKHKVRERFIPLVIFIIYCTVNR